MNYPSIDDYLKSEMRFAAITADEITTHGNVERSKRKKFEAEADLEPVPARRRELESKAENCATRAGELFKVGGIVRNIDTKLASFEPMRRHVGAALRDMQMELADAESAEARAATEDRSGNNTAAVRIRASELRDAVQQSFYGWHAGIETHAVAAPLELTRRLPRSVDLRFLRPLVMLAEIVADLEKRRDEAVERVLGLLPAETQAKGKAKGSKKRAA